MERDSTHVTNTNVETTWLRKGHKMMLKDVRGQFCGLLTNRSSSAMFEIQVLVSVQGDNVTNKTVGTVVLYFITSWNFLEEKTNNFIDKRVIHDAVQTGSSYLSLSVHHHTYCFQKWGKGEGCDFGTEGGKSHFECHITIHSHMANTTRIHTC